MCLAAHPDDEDGATLALARDRWHAKTYTVFFTRGEGGQNETGPELYRALAAIRTKETERASAIVGSEPVFLNFPDFGYSKTAAETYSHWGGRDEVLRRLVIAIRTLRPDVIITHHHTWPDRGNNHGHHQVVALAALEAMQAAADSTFHPELVSRGLLPWRAHKLLMRVWDYNDSSRAFQQGQGYSSLPDCAFPVGAASSTGETFNAISFKSLAEHRSQGMDKMQRPMDVGTTAWYKIIEEDANYRVDAADPFDGLPAVEDRALPASAGEAMPAEFRDLSYLDAEEPHAGPPPHVQIDKSIRVGVVESYDNTIDSALATLGVRHEAIDDATLEHGDLARYDAIVIDIRAYGKRPELVAHNTRLLEYLRRGGRMIVMYQKTQDWKTFYAPAPLILTHLRVTDETAHVTPLVADDRVFREPNTIEAKDWDGWVQERGLYFPARTDAFTKLLSMGDPGEAPMNTGLLRTTYGKGTYWYCALSLYRQLGLNHEGAFKLFANMLSWH